MNILSFGSLNIDYTYSVDHMVQKGETLSSSKLEVFPGGKGLNQAIALAKAGAMVDMAGCIGNDGLFLLDVLKENHVDTRFMNILSDERTGNAIIQKDKNGDNCILLYGGSNQAVTKKYIDTILKYYNGNDYILLQNEINNVDYIVEKASEKGMKIILNPSPMNEKILALPLDKITYFILNEVEASQLTKISYHDNEKELADALLAKFPNSHIVLTLGKAGSIYVDANHYYKQAIYPVKTVDTTAAGDTFTGYFFASIMNDMPIEEAMDLASKASSITVTRMGAAPSIPKLEELK